LKRHWKGESINIKQLTLILTETRIRHVISQITKAHP